MANVESKENPIRKSFTIHILEDGSVKTDGELSMFEVYAACSDLVRQVQSIESSSMAAARVINALMEKDKEKSNLIVPR